MGFEYKIEIKTEAGEERKIRGFTEMEFSKIKKIEDLCRKYKINTTEMIAFLIENIDEESVIKLAETLIQ